MQLVDLLAAFIVSHVAFAWVLWSSTNQGRRQMDEPKCRNCTHCAAGQCEAVWNDGGVKRAIRIAPGATRHDFFPAFHVYEFWCEGRRFKSRTSQANGCEQS
jgi:hypothetical protein